jgi:hypothetical protein
VLRVSVRTKHVWHWPPPGAINDRMTSGIDRGFPMHWCILLVIRWWIATAKPAPSR